MARIRRSSSIPLALALGVVSVGLTIALLVGWILVIVHNPSPLTALDSWLLTLGVTSFAVIIGVLVLFSVFLVRETRTVNRQTGFIDSVTHELKSPLSSLKLCLETLERDDLSDGQRDNVHQMMIEDVERLSIFIEAVLQASRLSHRGEGYALEDVVLRDLVESCADASVRYYKQPRDVIRIHIPRDIVLVTDRTALETVIKNVLDNAVKYSLGLEQPVDVTVEAHVEARTVRLEICDRGVGIPRKHQSRICERFFRAPHESVRARRGTGLGLFVVSALLRILGGKLRIRSGGVGRGTSVDIWIPLRGRREKTASERDALAASET